MVDKKKLFFVILFSITIYLLSFHVFIHKTFLSNKAHHSQKLLNVPVKKLMSNKAHHSQKLLYVPVKNLMTTSRITRNTSCPELSIHNKVAVEKSEKVHCQQHIPLESGCRYAKEYFQYDPVKRRCNKTKAFNICRFSPQNIECSYKKCGEDVYIHMFDPRRGKVVHIAESKSHNDSQIITNLLKYTKVTINNGYSFLFLSCNLDINKLQFVLTDDVVMSSPYNIVGYKKKVDRHELQAAININVILIDSLSRAHFYRSLRETITMFNKINLESEAEILDFELFQALHGHTVENLHAFFSGFVFPENMTDNERENHPLGVDLFYKFLKRNNYQTIYQDDMCYDAVWGMRLDLGNPRSWEDLRQAIKDSSIDNTGITMSSCKILEQLGLKHVFNTYEDDLICFNGQQQDSYFLSKILNDFTTPRKNLFAFTSLMFSHDAFGLRTQSLDGDLATFVEKISKLENTLTILMADHGNAYTKFVYLDNEGRYENFHPSLFMIIPKGVQKRLGESNLANLRINQKRLVTQLDLHHTIKYLVDDKHPNHGLLASISKKRTCDDLPLRQPNLCLCKGSNTPVQNTTDYIGHVEFAVGELNNIIIKSSPRKCKLLVPMGFDNVIQKQDSSNKVVTMFNIITESGFQSKNDVDRFSVAVSSVTSGSVDTLEMKLQSHDRLSSFGSYRECSDADAKFRLCICDRNGKVYTNKTSERRTSLSYNLFAGKVEIHEENADVIKKELVLNIRSFYEKKSDKKKILIAVTFEVINISLKKYVASIAFKNMDNMKRVTASECKADVNPNEVIYMCSLMRKYNVWGGSYSYDVTYTEIT